MWFQFPTGTSGISVQQQEFSVEVVDDEGSRYFRAPDHFAGLILDLPGFRHRIPPEGSTELDDLPKADPQRDGAINQLGGQVEALKLELESVRATIAGMSIERDNLKLKLHEATVRISELEEELEQTDLEDKKGSKK